jgi:hypothetical protein
MVIGLRDGKQSVSVFQCEASGQGVRTQLVVPVMCNRLSICRRGKLTMVVDMVLRPVPEELRLRPAPTTPPAQVWRLKEWLEAGPTAAQQGYVSLNLGSSHC